MLILKPLSVDWSVVGAHIPTVTFILHAGLITHALAHMLDSLVRVSRRVEENHFVSVIVNEERGQDAGDSRERKPIHARTALNPPTQSPVRR